LPAPSAKHPVNGASCDSALAVVEGYCTLIAHVPSTRARTLAKAALRLVEVSPRFARLARLWKTHSCCQPWEWPRTRLPRRQWLRPE